MRRFFFLFIRLLLLFIWCVVLSFVRVETETLKSIEDKTAKIWEIHMQKPQSMAKSIQWRSNESSLSLSHALLNL